MKNRKFYIIILGIILAVIGSSFILNNTASQEKLKIKAFYPEAQKIKLVKDIADDTFVSLNLPAVKRAYEVDGVIKAFVVSCVGYVGPIEVLAALDDESDELKGIEILNHNETVGYAEHIEENWFLERFKGIGANNI